MKQKVLAYLVTMLMTCIIYSQSFDVKRIRLGNHVNTQYTETKPIISYDNSTLIITRQNHPENVNGEKDEQDIYISVREDDGSWSTPKNIGSPLNNEFPNGISSLSKSGDTALVINIWDESEYQKGASLTVRTDTGWSNPKGIAIEGFINKSDYVDYYETSDGKHLFLAIKAKDSYGDQDIYVSEKIDDYNWSKPMNIGNVINTSGAEFSPFLTSNNKVLFFSSYSHGSYGNSDIFYSERLDDTWTNWSKPKNLGPNINTYGFEAYFTIPSKGDYAYFVSDVESNEGSRDIFKAWIPIELNATPGIIVRGQTHDQSTGELAQAKVTIQPIPKQMESKIFDTNEENEYTYRKSILEFPKSFQLIAEADNYMSAYQYKVIRFNDKREEILDLYMVPIRNGQTLITHDVIFESNKAELTAKGKKEVNRIIQYMIDYPINFEIACHVGSSGKAEVDQRLSEVRVNLVESMFYQAGIEKSRITTKAYGASIPFNNTLDLHISNPAYPHDRITFTVYDDRDFDGIADSLDKCIDEPGIAANSGCPEIKNETKEVLAQALTGIQFQTSKDVIKSSSYTILDNVVNIMRDNPSYYLKIMGHTDSQGNDDTNQLLSEQRAKATLQYLVDKGISSDRMSAYGYGESEPVASNATAAGRAQNRRVVFEILFDEELLKIK